jgi:hypothetical protein
MMMLRLFSVIPSVRVFLFSAALAFSLGLTSSASADLAITVTGVAGAPTSTWTFSGGYDIPTVGGSCLGIAGCFDTLASTGNFDPPNGTGFYPGGGQATLSGQVNNWQGNDWTSPQPFYDGAYNKTQVALPGNLFLGAPGVVVNSLGSGILGTPQIPHNVTGFNLQSDLDGVPRFTWFADGPFFGLEPLVFQGSSVAQFDVGILNQIVGIGDSQVITASTPALGNLTITFNAVAGQIPEPSSALLIGLGLAAMGASKRRAGAAASI